MLRLSKKADYALMAMKHLALSADRGSSSAREIAEQYDIPIELMAKVLQRLVQRGLLLSHQGTRGGYQLARQPVRMPAGLLIFKNLAFRGFWITQWMQRAEASEKSAMFDQLFPAWSTSPVIAVGNSPPPIR